MPVRLVQPRASGKPFRTGRFAYVFVQCITTAEVSLVVIVGARLYEESGVSGFRLDNLGLQPGSKRKAKRKGRGIVVGQGNNCGFGMRGQTSRLGPGVRKGFEGGQMPLYRRLPKLRRSLELIN
ncbi:uncharacterized protein A4U43_C02F15550 [Asparagus officinalis]|uniref:Uncharacterized protein n=1 Tax=Asparagus officinalis TaxID=4686 RepID=A0A5P1FLA5_ASPOF|nr:uncharacterized protein A4U43_C02F15550 [Asparagus officinalis]